MTPGAGAAWDAEALGRLPALQFDSVFHVGSFNPADKRGHSWEGNGLSVSLHPDEWIEIAELGGQPTWELTAPQAGAGELARRGFLDMHALEPAQRDAIEAWATAGGYLDRQPRFKVIWMDPEANEQRYMLVGTMDEAEQECDEDNEGRIEPVVAACATDLLVERCGFRPPDDNAFDIAATFFAEDHGLDGCWWEDRLDVYALSAPRGVINTRRLVEWTAAKDEKPLERPVA